MQLAFKKQMRIQMMSRSSNCIKYTFREYNGSVVAPQDQDILHNKIVIRYSDLAKSWDVTDIHLHQQSEEYYFLLQGKLWVWVGGVLVTLRPNELLQVKAQVPHAIVKGKGAIEHLVIRVPASNDKQTISQLPAKFPPLYKEKERELREDWGCRVSIQVVDNQNCWLFGVGQARFQSSLLGLAYIKYTHPETADAYRESYQHQLHIHRDSWEYYAVLRGSEVLQVEDEYVEIKDGEILGVPPQVKHVFHELQTPFEGFTLRTPLLNDKVTF